MATFVPNSPHATRPASSAWTPELRGLVSVLLVIHLLALALIFWANNDRADQRQSAVVSRAKRVLNLYLYPLWLDRTWDNRLAGSDPLDADHALEFSIASRFSEVLRFPDKASNPEERERWQRAARLVAQRNEDDPNSADQLIMELAKVLRTNREYGHSFGSDPSPVSQIKVECRRRVRQTVDDSSPNPVLDREEIPYVATIKWSPSGEAFLTKPAADARDVSPVVPKAAGNVPPSPPGTNALPWLPLPGQKPPSAFPPDPATLPASPAPAPGTVPMLPEVK